MGWSDARNERDRAMGGGNVDHDRSAGEKAAAAARNRDAMSKSASRNEPGLTGGYFSGNPYPGYRGPTGTRNPKAKPEPSPGPSRFSPGDKPRPSIWDRVFQPRRTPNPTPSYKATLHNIGVALNVGLPGPTMAAKVAAMAMGIGKQYSDYTGMKMGPGDWDPKDKIALPGLPDFTSIFYHKEPR